jgi:hypothetical protein
MKHCFLDGEEAMKAGAAQSRDNAWCQGIFEFGEIRLVLLKARVNQDWPGEPVFFHFATGVPQVIQVGSFNCPACLTKEDEV